LIASADQNFEEVDVNTSSVSPIKFNIVVLKEFMLAEVCYLCVGRIVGSENTTITYRPWLDDVYFTNIDIAIARYKNITSGNELMIEIS
jgi:hypothetical protein